MSVTLDPRVATNPLFNRNRMKLGVFALNGPPIAMTKVSERFQPSWPNALDVASLADGAGYEAVVPYARWGSFGPGPRHYSAHVFENLTWAAAIAARTRRACVMSTLQVQTIHPLMAAKAMTTIDHVSNGRFCLNLVIGNAMENAMFGIAEIPHDQRYDYAAEWIETVRRLWTDEDGFDFHGRYIHLDGALSQPKPIQKPYPPLMNAARSASGQRFVAKHCEIAFTRDNERSTVVAQVKEYRRAARDHHGRDIQVWCNCVVVQRESRREAERYVDYFVEKQGDDEAVDVFIRLLNPGAVSLPPEQRAAMRHKLKRGLAGQPLVGTADDIAAAIATLAQQGIDGILLNWVDPQDGVRRFNGEVLPLLEQAGLRERRAA